MNASRWTPVLLAALLAARSGNAGAQDEPRAPKPPPPPRPAVPPPPPARSQLQPRGVVYLMEPAPDFELDGSEGRPVKLSSLRGNRVLLVFEPYKEQLAALKPYVPALTASDIMLVGVCGEKQHTLKSLAQRDTIPFLMLADVTGDVSSLYGLFDRATRTTQPGVFLLDPKGVVRFMVLGPTSSTRELIAMVASALPGP